MLTIQAGKGRVLVSHWEVLPNQGKRRSKGCWRRQRGEKASTMPNTELQQETALAEVSPATSEELEWCQRALSAVPEPQRELFAAIPVDVRAVCCMRRALSPRASSRLSSVALILNATG